MADFITKNQLINNVEKNNNTLRKSFALLETKLSKIVKNRNEFESSVFISHSHKNADLVEYLVAVLTNLKVEVYVDWMDDEMSYPPSSKTALKIKDMIDVNKKFILLATNEGIESKWCNWELGIGDAHKYIENIALLPVAENSGNWIGNEYLQIYPYINKKYKSLDWDDEYYLIYPNGKRKDFIQWLKD
ncbi:toll/interleukin-1 receptor domain-containing protein [Winogradskyella luteola]|uniref:Toll/interleukin-1 receptor domain-containing protein n=1 Tax=Winogradskyella luteola TaxID=2828330 RepID=A0A9X1F807_9FLAO|nr:toll/interleukin-1 receptor domain-containing protein [Winogradskyella luteola]MBV7268954.1 toll/interleukin-1 receptor domain-containing protein [Winogradskyella luteola]